jgi:hypothetical protein
MMSHKSTRANDRIVLLTTLLAGLALVGAATGTLGAAFFGGGFPWETILTGIVDLIGGAPIDKVLGDVLGSLF